MKLNTSGRSQANSLISSGKIKKSSSWNPPSTDMENTYIKNNGIAKFGRWHLGIAPEADPKTKAYWHFIFTSDFTNVDYSGLRACITRAAQAGHTDIENTARNLYDRAKTKLGIKD